MSQEFLDSKDIINRVDLGPLTIRLNAERTVMDARRIKVVFKSTAVSVFGNELFRKDISGSGVWKQRYVDDELRVMNTPSIFVLNRRR